MNRQIQLYIILVLMIILSLISVNIYWRNDHLTQIQFFKQYWYLYAIFGLLYIIGSIRLIKK